MDSYSHRKILQVAFMILYAHAKWGSAAEKEAAKERHPDYNFDNVNSTYPDYNIKMGDFIDKIENEEIPDMSSLKEIAQAFKKIQDGDDPRKVIGTNKHKSYNSFSEKMLLYASVRKSMEKGKPLLEAVFEISEIFSCSESKTKKAYLEMNKRTKQEKLDQKTADLYIFYRGARYLIHRGREIDFAIEVAFQRVKSIGTVIDKSDYLNYNYCKEIFLKYLKTPPPRPQGGWMIETVALRKI